MLHLNTIEQLIQSALKARNYSYAPYSHFYVGAALLAEDGKIYTGCNIESAAFSPTNCAERTAFFKAVSEGQRQFQAIAVAGGTESPGESVLQRAVTPCGVCRQVMAEFCQKDFQVIAARSEKVYQIFSLKELLPQSFGSTDLNNEPYANENISETL